MLPDVITILAIADDRVRRCDQSSIDRLAWKDSERSDYCETGAPDDPSAGMVGKGMAALFDPLPVAPAEFVVPVCPRRPRCAPRVTGGALAATGCIGGWAMYWKFSLIALLPVSYDRCTNTLLVTGSLACANADGMADTVAAAAAALNAAVRTSEPASRTVGRTVTLCSSNVHPVGDRSAAGGARPKNWPAPECGPSREHNNTLGGYQGETSLARVAGKKISGQITAITPYNEASAAVVCGQVVTHRS
ncbi:hypothetical protein [Burkholderia lata]|uniref:hypothetical protein n=1 Tax=Burkholderia lata (strain ATCC 17760 / DSM 23089 / LMG 22485 / NCIMB 9086 / R18194 / 383) TaxID=482957 RepID=UPI00158160E0|nr:hypothetical protein [Burkholderia lata]